MRIEHERALSLLREGHMELLGIMPRASNYTFAATVDDGEAKALVVYKPRAGETPLWDFPSGTLYAREVAAYELSEALGWRIVPPTVRREGPHGLGSVQLFVDATPNEHYFTLMPAHADVFRRVAAFDVVANNADRKAGHCLLEDGTDRIWFIDHGVCFHREEKLRTVMWDFAGEPIADDVREALARFANEVPAIFGELLSAAEVRAMRARARALARTGVLPEPPEDRRPYPWPPI